MIRVNFEYSREKWGFTAKESVDEKDEEETSGMGDSTKLLLYEMLKGLI